MKFRLTDYNRLDESPQGEVEIEVWDGNPKIVGIDSGAFSCSLSIEEAYQVFKLLYEKTKDV